MSSCNRREQTTDHVLKNCTASIRKDYWQNNPKLPPKLYENKEELRTTAEFILRICLAV
uniref:Uncharacterized protein n=1 Tax=Arion vulgaris TaxID=1028688 RepID=A0A0B6ZJ49_9EUPU